MLRNGYIRFHLHHVVKWWLASSWRKSSTGHLDGIDFGVSELGRSIIPDSSANVLFVLIDLLTLLDIVSELHITNVLVNHLILVKLVFGIVTEKPS